MKINLNKTLFSLFYILIFISAIGRIQYAATMAPLWINIYRASIYSIILIGIAYILFTQSIRFNKITLLLTAMVLYEIVVTIYRYNRINQTLFNEIVLDLLAWPLIFILTYNFITDFGVPHYFKYISICGVSLILIFTAINISQIGSIGINPAVGGVAYCVVVLPLVYFYFPKRLQKIIAIIILIIVTVSTKRSSFLAMIAGVFAYYISDAVIQKISKKKINKMLFIMLVVIIAVFLGFYMLENSSLEIMQEFTSGDETLSGRTLLWERILTSYNGLSFGEKLFGSGMHAVKYKYNPYGLGWYAHNSFIEALYDYGVVGLIFLLAFVFILIKKAVEMTSKKSSVAPIMASTIPQMLLFASSSYFFEVGQITLLLSYMWCFCITIYDQELFAEDLKKSNK